MITQYKRVKIIYLSKTNYFKGTDFHYFPEQFSVLSDDMKKKGKDVAKQHLVNRFNGKKIYKIKLKIIQNPTV